MCMKRIKPIQMQMQPARMDKVLCFSSNIFILQKTDLVLGEPRAPVCVQFQTHKSLPLAKALLGSWDTFAILSCYSTHWNTVGLLIPSEPHVVAPEGGSLLQYESALWDFNRAAKTEGLFPMALLGNNSFSVTCSECTKYNKCPILGFSTRFLCARYPAPSELQ